MLSSKEKIKRHFSHLEVPYASHSNWIWAFFRKREKTVFSDLIHDLKKDICLDLGAGSCEYSKILLNKGGKKCICVDFSSSLRLKAEEPGIEKISCDVEKFETPKKYDLILCLGIIEFLDQPKEFMIRLKNFLKPEGKILILLPLSTLGSFIYFLFYLLKGIVISRLTLKQINHFLGQEAFVLEKMAPSSFFSGFAIYSLPPLRRGK